MCTSLITKYWNTRVNRLLQSGKDCFSFVVLNGERMKGRKYICHYIIVSIERMPRKGNVFAAEAESQFISTTIRQFYHRALSVEIVLTSISKDNVTLFQ